MGARGGVQPQEISRTHESLDTIKLFSSCTFRVPLPPSIRGADRGRWGRCRTPGGGGRAAPGGRGDGHEPWATEALGDSGEVESP